MRRSLCTGDNEIKSSYDTECTSISGGKCCYPKSPAIGTKPVGIRHTLCAQQKGICVATSSYGDSTNNYPLGG